MGTSRYRTEILQLGVLSGDTRLHVADFLETKLRAAESRASYRVDLHSTSARILLWNFCGQCSYF